MLKPSYLSTQYIDPSPVETYAHNKISAIIIDDIDHNGFVDLVTFPSQFTIAGYIGPVVWTNTNGVFTPSSSAIQNPGQYQYFRDSVVGDFNNDGFKDYFQTDQGWELNNRDVHSLYGNSPTLLLGSSTGLKWQPLDSWLTNPVGSKTFNHIADSADYDGDGDLDIVVAAFWDLKIYENQSNGKFTQREDTVPVKFNVPNNFGGASGSTFIDLNGKYAIAIGTYRAWDINTSITPVSILTQQNGQFVETYTVARPNLGGRERNYGASEMFNMDMNGDGREDLVITWETESSGGINDGLSNMSGGNGQRYADLTNTIISIYFQDANGQLIANNKVYNASDRGAGSPVLFKDFNLDGYVDFYTSGFFGKPSQFNQAVYINDGHGNFSHPTDMFNISEAFPDGYSVSPFFVDANNDGATDVVAVRPVFAQPATHTIGQEIITFLSDRPAYNINGNNKFLATLTDKVTDGGAGTDTAIFSGKFSDYTIVKNSPQSITVTDKTVGRDGQDTFVNIERVKFDDDIIAFDTTGNAGQAYRLYTAALGRAPEESGLGFWINALDNNAALHNVSKAFVDSNEFHTKFYGDGSNSTFINALYNNVLHRAPEQGGYDFWVGRLNQGAERADVLIGFSESNENVNQTAGLVGQGISYTEWLG